MAKTGTSSVTQRAQIGFEADSAPGVAVPASFKPRSGKHNVGPKSERKEIAASGDLFPASSVELDRWVEGSVAEATPCYRELAYVLRMIAGRPVVTTTDGKTERIFTLGGGEVTTMTAEYGDSTQGGRGLGVFVSGYSLEWSRNGKVSAYDVTFKGADFEDGVSLTSESSLTQLKLVPTSGQHIHVFIGDSVAAVRSTNAVEQPGVLSVKLTGGEKAGMVKFFDSVDIVDLYATSTLDLTMRKAQGIALEAALRDGSTKYARVVLTFGIFVFEFISAIGLATEGERTDDSGAFVVKPSLRIYKADDLAPTFRLVNDLPAYPGEELESDRDGDGEPDSTDLQPDNPNIL